EHVLGHRPLLGFGPAPVAAHCAADHPPERQVRSIVGAEAARAPVVAALAQPIADALLAGERVAGDLLAARAGPRLELPAVRLPQLAAELLHFLPDGRELGRLSAGELAVLVLADQLA